MNNLTNQQPIEFKDYYLNEYALWNGENFITFDLVYVDVEHNTVIVATTDTGKIVLMDYELYKGDWYQHSFIELIVLEVQ